MNAPTSQSTGKKIPKKNIIPWPFRSVVRPSVKSTNMYKSAAPIPIAHHIISPLFGVSPQMRLLARAVADVRLLLGELGVREVASIVERNESFELVEATRHGGIGGGG